MFTSLIFSHILKFSSYSRYYRTFFGTITFENEISSYFSPRPSYVCFDRFLRSVSEITKTQRLPLVATAVSD